MGDIQFDRVPAIAPASEPHVRNSSDAPAGRNANGQRPKPRPRPENAPPDASNDFATDDTGFAAEDTDPPHSLDRFA